MKRAHRIPMQPDRSILSGTRPAQTTDFSSAGSATPAGTNFGRRSWCPMRVPEKERLLMIEPRSGLLLFVGLALGLGACGESASLPVAAGMGPDPELPAPTKTLLPTVNIAPAKGWPNGAMPTAAAGLEVAAYADGLDHPRWLYVLPNGDVLVAETNAPPKPEDGKGIKGWVMGLMMKRAGAGGKSADRITLLRDEDGDGIVDSRSVFLDGLHSPFGMALVGDDFYVANSDAVVRFPYEEGAVRIEAPGETVVELPAGPINHHWTKNVIASPDGAKL
jgi:glucose/arabinose dehydrogenase